MPTKLILVRSTVASPDNFKSDSNQWSREHRFTVGWDVPDSDQAKCRMRASWADILPGTLRTTRNLAGSTDSSKRFTRAKKLQKSVRIDVGQGIGSSMTEVGGQPAPDLTHYPPSPGIHSTLKFAVANVWVSWMSRDKSGFVDPAPPCRSVNYVTPPS